MSPNDTLESSSARAIHTRRDVIRGGVSLGLAAAAFGALPRGARASSPAKGSTCLTILYAAGPGLRFDADYYRDHHLVTIMKLYGRSIGRFELRTVDAPAAAGAAGGAPPAPHYAAAVNIWVADPEAFEAGNKAHGATLVADVPHFTNAPATIQYDSVEGAMGADASAIKVGDHCLTILYPNKPDVRWDVDYYRAHHMPLIMRLYGAKAIRRFELRKGQKAQMGGKPPPFVGTVNIYIEDQAAFEAAGRAHGQELRNDVPHFSSEQPEAFPTTVHGVA